MNVLGYIKKLGKALGLSIQKASPASTPAPKPEVPAEPVNKAAVHTIEPTAIPQLAKDFTRILGGRKNLTQIGACVTRLRLQVQDTSFIKEDEIKALGAMGIARIGSHNLQIVIGPQAELVAEEMKRLPADVELTDGVSA